MFARFLDDMSAERAHVCLPICPCATLLFVPKHLLHAVVLTTPMNKHCLKSVWMHVRSSGSCLQVVED